jgi:hypothetical protein
MGSLPEDFEGWRPLPLPEPKVLNSPYVVKVKRLKRELTAQLFIRRGLFWDAVSEMRERWNVTAQEQLPDRPGFTLCPEKLPIERGGEWVGDIVAIEEKAIPEGMRRREGDLWSRFLSACVLYDPPELELLRFAAYGDPQPGPLDSLLMGPPPPGPEEIIERTKELGAQLFDQFQNPGSKPSAKPRPDLAMSLPSLVKLPDPYEVEMVGLWFWHHTVRELIDRYIRPQGLDVKEVLHNVLKTSGISAEYAERMSEVSETYYIVVDEYTSEEDLENTRRMIRAAQERNPGGRPARDPLAALQCALLHDKYNETEPGDGRIWRWSYKRLADEFRQFGVRNARSAEAHVKLGRELLKNRPT